MSDNTQTVEWYLARDGQQHGPISDAELKKIIELGYLKPTDLVWRQGWAEWQPATVVLPPPGVAAPPAPPSASTPARQPQSPQAPGQGEGIGQTGKQAQAANPAPGAGPGPVKPGASDSGKAQPTQRAPSPGTTPHVRLDPIAPSHGPRPGPGAQGTQPQRPGANLGPAPRGDDRAAMADADTAPFPASPGQGAAGSGPSAPRTSARGTQPGTEPRWDPQPGTAAKGAQANGPHSLAPAPARPHPGHPGPSPQQMSREPTPEFDEEEEEARGFPWRTAVVLVLLAALGGGAYALHRTGQLQSLPFLSAPWKQGEVPIVSAPTEPATSPPAASSTSRSVATAEPAQPQPAPADAGRASFEAKTATSPLWQLLKQDYPDWYDARVAEAKELQNQSKDEGEIAAIMMRSVVELRRKHSATALAASPQRLKSIATSFVGNLDRFRKHSTTACYGFISQGETSPAVVAINSPEYRSALDAQLLAIFTAIREGQTAPIKHEPPQRPDYDVLTAELGRRGWNASDLQTFSNARALSRAAPEKVCQMVNDWFSAQLAVKDPAAQTRLLSEALKPVVGG